MHVSSERLDKLVLTFLSVSLLLRGHRKSPGLLRPQERWGLNRDYKENMQKRMSLGGVLAPSAMPNFEMNTWNLGQAGASQNACCTVFLNRKSP